MEYQSKVILLGRWWMFLNGLLDTRKNLGFTGLSCNDFEDFGGGLCKESIISRDPVSIVSTLGLDLVSSGPPKTN